MSDHWIAAWGLPIAKPPRTCAEWVHDTTVRFTMLMTVPGKSLKFHFSNLFGEHEATITKASVSVQTEGSSIDVCRFAAITFNGAESGTMAAGEGIVSDPADLVYEAGETLTVSLYFKDFAQLTTAHANSGEFIKKWVCSGDYTAEADLPFLENMDADRYPFIHTVESLSPEGSYAIVAYGDSITAQTWPDRLTRRLLAMGRKDVAIVRKAISGARVLREYPCDCYRHYGPKGLDRFEREVVLPGVKKVFILHGINDIIHPVPDGGPFRPMSDQPTAAELIEGLQFYIDKAHENGIEVYMSGILPFEDWRTYNEEKEQIRELVNFWIYRGSEIDGILPFEVALMNPDKPLQMLPEFDSGDHLHPSDAGAQMMADCIPEELL